MCGHKKRLQPRVPENVYEHRKLLCPDKWPAWVQPRCDSMGRDMFRIRTVYLKTVICRQYGRWSAIATVIFFTMTLLPTAFLLNPHGPLFQTKKCQILHIKLTKRQVRSLAYDPFIKLPTAYYVTPEVNLEE